jgi:hypothetical protein
MNFLAWKTNTGDGLASLRACPPWSGVKLRLSTYRASSVGGIGRNI